MQYSAINDQYDVAVIGAGVVGCAVARELAAYKLRTVVIEKELDVGLATSSRNSGVLHSGIHYAPGSLRAECCVKGNRMMEKICRELNVKCKYTGKLTVALNESEFKELHRLYEQGRSNGLDDLRIIGPEEMTALQPGIAGLKALHTPNTGIVDPIGLTVALAENAAANGTHFLLGNEVTAITRDGAGFLICTGEGNTFKARVIVNAAGLNCAAVSELAGIDTYHIYPCRGEYFVLDKRLGNQLKLLIYPVPGHGSSGLGIHLTNTVDGNILIGPSNEYIGDAADAATTGQVMKLLLKEGRELLPGLSNNDCIRSFAGVRPKQTSPQIGGFSDFVIRHEPEQKGLINLIGIESPGLTSAPYIAVKVRDMVNEAIPLEPNEDFVPELMRRPGKFSECTPEEKQQLIRENPDYGSIICRCEEITKAEIIEALKNPLGARLLVSIKNRTRQGMGRCQGGFCTPRLFSVIKEVTGLNADDLLLKSRNSVVCRGQLREI